MLRICEELLSLIHISLFAQTVVEITFGIVTAILGGVIQCKEIGVAFLLSLIHICIVCAGMRILRTKKLPCRSMGACKLRYAIA